MTGQAARPVWPSATPPPAEPALSWELRQIAQLPRVRAELRQHATTQAAGRGPAEERADDLRDQLILALDEMASNALRHGGGQVRAAVRVTADAYLVEVSDQAAGTPPSPAVGRDPSEGGLGLYLIAEMATAHGWYVSAGNKYVWALLPRA
ncbi:ATP-binding protein [Blastococcus haudaquaticus]|uniref:Anti-sigma regulatory factor (Ser/Thr protein kinase) n=1 Tax=Blastococcus haudaquaticus TaxID=1938745 RepID=A0A286GKX6_9ACTN|nr:ATP-binding protein [Blastococcus haudaquaticus]SOD95739.1 Anti-sigma regulatory factor (Ser/Thr protein kinase) [Blastococcus haudaquaticus]